MLGGLALALSASASCKPARTTSEPPTLRPRGDHDRDGVDDLHDQCPLVAGAKPTGCALADRDGDTVGDAEDGCPDAPGVTLAQVPSYAVTVATPGCPDGDGDGVTDDKDQCPYQPIAYSGCDPEYLHGCPDDCSLQFGWPGGEVVPEAQGGGEGEPPPTPGR